MLGGSQSRSGRGGEEKNSQPPLGIETWNPDRPARSPALYRLSYRGSSKLFYFSFTHFFFVSFFSVPRWQSLDGSLIPHSRNLCGMLVL
jgi:hypothetical protein